MSNILTTNGLSKKYHDLMVCDNISLTIKKGDVYGFVGLNGSGKTTFIRMITKLIRPTSGTFELFEGGAGKLSSMVETPSLYLDLNAVDNVKAQCRIANIPIKDNPERLLKLVGLGGVEKNKVAKNFSLGMRQRLGIAMAMVVEPQFMLLDEPTNGLDPAGMVEIRELLKKFNKELGITILISSHILAELDKLATTYGFIHHGKIIKEATSSEVHADCTTAISVECSNPSQLMGKLPKTLSATLVDNNNIRISGGHDDTLPQILQLAHSANIVVTNIQKTEQGLEDYFINLIGGKK